MSDIPPPPNPLLPPNRTPLETHVAQGLSRLSKIPVPIHQLWNPHTCPVALLPWLAWSLNLETWDSGWSEALKRQQVAAAINIARHKGTAKSVRDVVASFGSHLTLREWWQTHPRGEPYTFSLVLTLGDGVPHTAAFQQQIRQRIDSVKPVRAHYTLTAGIRAESTLGLLAVGRSFIYCRLETEASA